MTGATGGVGSLAVSCLSKLGYKVTALTGKDGEHAFLRSLGAADVISRAGLQMGTRPLEKSTWAGAVDAVGGDILAWLTKTMNYGGAIANSGLTAGTELHTTRAAVHPARREAARHRLGDVPDGAPHRGVAAGSRPT